MIDPLVLQLAIVNQVGDVDPATGEPLLPPPATTADLAASTGLLATRIGGFWDNRADRGLLSQAIQALYVKLDCIEAVRATLDPSDESADGVRVVRTPRLQQLTDMWNGTWKQIEAEAGASAITVSRAGETGQMTATEVEGPPVGLRDAVDAVYSGSPYRRRYLGVW